MRYLHQDLGELVGGEVVQVTLSGTEANVKLMDTLNFQNYRSGRRHTYYGGHVTQSPVHLPVPHAGHWHVTVDLGGYAGSVNAGIRVISG